MRRLSRTSSLEDFATSVGKLARPVMFLRATTRKKDGTLHRYFSLVENQRVLLGLALG